jgi:hypothetical protein
MRSAIQLLLVALTIGTGASSALATDLKSDEHNRVRRVLSGSEPLDRRGAEAEGRRFMFQCDDGFLDSAYYQHQGYVYGNAFDVGTGGALAFIAFWHYGWQTLDGPYDYNIRVFDEATCTEIAVITGLQADDAASTDQEERRALLQYNVLVTGLISVLIEPLSCASPTDCFPCVYFDFTDPMNGCGRVFPLSAPRCTPYDARDFVLRIDVDVPGACCLLDHCEIYLEEYCSVLGGTYQGPDIPCGPNSCPPSSVEGESVGVSSLSLHSAPNPTTGDISIEYRLPVASTVTLEVFSAGGTLVRRVEEGKTSAGSHALRWDGLDASGHTVPSGVYLARITTPGGSTTGRIVVAR